MQDDTARPVSVERAIRQVRLAGQLACLPCVLTLGWWGLMGWLAQGDAPGVESRWEAALTIWATNRFDVPMPFALGLALMLLGPVAALVGGFLVLYWLRRAPAHVARILPVVAALCAVSLLSSVWIGAEHVWHEDLPSGHASGTDAFGPGPCCGPWHLLLSAWLLWATVRYGPVFRALAPDPAR